MAVAKQALNSVHGAAVFRRRVRVLSQAISEAIPDAGTVLDVGCGDGSIARAIMDTRPDLVFEGIDVFLRPNVAIPARVYDGAAIPSPDHSFDWVTIVDVLHHTDDPAAVLSECRRVARRGVVIKDHLREGFLARPTLRFMDWVGNRGHDVRLPYNYLSQDEWNSVFARVGLRIETWTMRLDIYPPPFGLAFDRRLHFVALVSPPG
jgi:SAM-dependent methyltransferase